MIRTENRALKKLLMIIISTVSMLLVLTLAFELPLNIIGRVSAAEKVVYLKEMQIFQENSEAEARAECERRGYTFLPVDLNKGTESDSFVYIGYKTTENRDEALYNISLLDMNGGFQIRDYQELYDEYQKSNYGAAETLQMATMDFINSYKEGSPKTLDAYDGLNLLHVPEAGDMPFGDYVVKGKTDIDFYARVLSQAGTGTVNAILSLLSAGLAPYTIQSIIVDDDEEEEALTWAEKMADSALWDIIDSDDLSQDEKDEYSRQYGDDAKAIFKQMQDFATNYENSLAFYDENKAQKEMAGSNLEETVDKMDEMDESDTCDIYVEAYKLLNKYMANSDMPLGEWIVEMGKMTSDEVDYTQLFPMIDSMSYAQARMTELTGFIPTASNLGENVRSKEYQELLDQTRNKLQNLIGDNSISIWSNSDPEIASKKVAFTSFAIRQNAASSLLND